MVKTALLRFLYSLEVGSRRLSLKLLLRMRKESRTRRSSWTPVGSGAGGLLGLGPLLLAGTAVEGCPGAGLPWLVTEVSRVGTTQGLLVPLPVALEMGIAVPAPAVGVGAAELLLVVLVPTGVIQLLPFVVALAWEMMAVLEMGTAVLSAVALPAELLPGWEFVVLVAGVKTVVWEEMEVRFLLPTVVLEIVTLGVVIVGMAVVSAVVSAVVVSVVVVSVVVVSVVVVSTVVSLVAMSQLPRGNPRSQRLGPQHRFGRVLDTPPGHKAP